MTSPPQFAQDTEGCETFSLKWANWDKMVTGGPSLLLVSRVSSPGSGTSPPLTSRLQVPALRTQTFKWFLALTELFSHIKHVSVADFKTELASIHWRTHKVPKAAALCSRSR